MTKQYRWPCTPVGDPQRAFVSCPGHIRGLTATPPRGKDAAIQAAAPGSASPWDYGSSGLCSGNGDKVQEAPEEGNRLCTLEHDKEERNWVVQRPRRGHIPILWSREGGTAGDHPKAALSGESCLGGGWGLVGLEEGSF